MFSEMEKTVMANISEEPITIKELVGLVYPFEAPMEANNYLAGVVRRINKKCKHNKLSWYINTVGGGRGGLKIWKEKK